MTQRVVATDAVRQAAQRMRFLLRHGLQQQVQEVMRAGRALSNPQVWDGTAAMRFRQAQWPQHAAALTRALAALERFEDHAEQVVEEILRVGSEGAAIPFQTAKSVDPTVASVMRAMWPATLLHRAWGEVNRGRTFATWLGRAAGAKRSTEAIFKGPEGQAAIWRSIQQRYASEQARLQVLQRSTNPGLVSRVLARLGAPEETIGLVGKFGRVAGPVGLAFTVGSGVHDAFTGGGYAGWRGDATRVMGVVGAVGAGVLLAAAVGVVTLNPVSLTVIGAAVLAYGAWSLGNDIYDHREAIHRAATVAGASLSRHASSPIIMPPILPSHGS